MVQATPAPFGNTNIGVGREGIIETEHQPPQDEVPGSERCDTNDRHKHSTHTASKNVDAPEEGASKYPDVKDGNGEPTFLEQTETQMRHFCTPVTGANNTKGAGTHTKE